MYWLGISESSFGAGRPAAVACCLVSRGILGCVARSVENVRNKDAATATCDSLRIIERQSPSLAREEIRALVTTS
jgi:hypothetical protein